MKRVWKIVKKKPVEKKNLNLKRMLKKAGAGNWWIGCLAGVWEAAGSLQLVTGVGGERRGHQLMDQLMTN